MDTRETLSAKLEPNIEPVPFAGCWLWTKATDPKGYGVVRVNGRMRRAHRVVWELERGTIPEGWRVAQSCGIPTCVCLGHLFLSRQDGGAFS